MFQSNPIKGQKKKLLVKEVFLFAGTKVISLNLSTASFNCGSEGSTEHLPAKESCCLLTKYMSVAQTASGFDGDAV